MLGKPRSGTTVTHLTLSAHPNVSALDGELAPVPFFTKGLLTYTKHHQTELEEQHGHRAIFDAITRINNPNATTFGAKTACGNKEQAESIVHTLRTHFPDIKVIHTIRTDLVAHYGSGYMGRNTGIMHSWSPGFGRPVDSVKFTRRDVVRFAESAKIVNGIFGCLSESHDYLRLEYESYLQNPETVPIQLFDFLGLERLEVTQPSKKVLPPPQEYILNYNQCHEWIREGPSLLDKIPTARGIVRRIWPFGRG